MTTVTFIAKECFVCANTSRQVEPGIRGFGEPDELDSRPGGVHRSSIYMYIQRCIHCGYCAPNIRQGTDETRQVVSSEFYQNLLKDESLPETATSFLCWSHIQQSLENFVDSGWATLFAAWVCDDDTRFKESAGRFRYKAYELFSRAQCDNQPFARSGGDEEIIIIDLLRRSNHFVEALEHIQKGLQKDWDTRTQQVLLFEEELCEQRDSRRHLFSEAVEDND